MIVRGLVRVALAWLATYVLAFAVAELAPGAPAERAARTAARLPDDARAPEARRAIIEAVERELGLGGGPIARLARATARAATLDPGVYWRDRRPVADVIAPGLGGTAARATFVLLLALLLGTAAGLGAASAGGLGAPASASSGGTARAAWWPALGRAAIGVVTALALAVPTVWLCQLALLGSVEAAGSSVVAVLVMAVAPAAVIATHARGAAEETQRSPLAAAVLARGASARRLVWVHAARLAAPRLAPLAASTVGFALGAAAVVERALALPGAGRTLAGAAATGDVPVVAALAALAAAAVAATGALAHVLARVADPRLDA